MPCGSRSFQRKKPLLPLKPPAIVRKLSIASNNSMTRNGHCNGITRTGSGHGASCRRLSARSRDLLIRSGLSTRNLLQCLPHLAMKDRRLHV